MVICKYEGQTNVMNQVTQRISINTDPDPDPRSSPPRVDHRTQLDNCLQFNGGPGRLDWTSFWDGPANDPTWTAVYLGPLCGPHLGRSTYLYSTVDGVEWSRAEAGTLGAAKEEAARRVLRTFRFEHMANTGRFAPG